MNSICHAAQLSRTKQLAGMLGKEKRKEERKKNYAWPAASDFAVSAAMTKPFISGRAHNAMRLQTAIGPRLT
jgi:hypothetical protein